jgi:hypothetical protein
VRATRRAHRGAPAAVLLTATALALGACGGGHDEGQTAATPQPEQQQQAPRSVEDGLGFDQAGILARQSRVEAAIRDCMKQQGFDYVPVDPYAQRAAITGSARLSDEDFLNQFGYGISTFWGRGGAQADPNEQLRTNLPPADRRAYDRALWGENKGASFSEAVDSGDFTRLGGCTKKATEAVFGGAELLTQLQEKLDELDERILEDQRMVRALEEWTACMAKAGHRYEDPDDIDSVLLKRMERIVGPVQGPFATGPATGERTHSYDRGALAALQRDEVALARADFACERKEIEPVEAKTRPQYEERFRRENEALISQVKPVR